MRGNAEPKKRLYSRAEDATLANPLGPPVRGWAAISERLDEAASTLQSGESVQFERIATVTAQELAYTVEIERYQNVSVEGADGLRNFELRVTTIYRRENEGWKISHRHADPITTERAVTTVLGQGPEYE
jgi:ketosteroid isomerase-like protein